MTTGLQVYRLIPVSVNLAPTGAQFANFDSLLIVGDSDIIDVGERMRSYNSIKEVAADFGTSAPEYEAADLFFSQKPQPTQLYIGSWARVATHGLLTGGVLTPTDQTLTVFTAITNGGVDLTIDGDAVGLTGLDFHSETNLNGVASVVTAALAGKGTCTWDGEKFQIKSASTGTGSTLAYATTGAGVDVSTILKLTAATASPPVAGIAAETALSAVTKLDDLATPWYGMMIASTNVPDADHEAIAPYIEATTHIYFIPTSNTQVLSSTVTTDIASKMKAGGYLRTFVQYSQIPYAVASAAGREFTVDFTANNSVITLMYKEEPGVNPELLTPSQADTLIAKRCNFFASYNNGTAIMQNAVMAGSAFLDEIHGTDALANALQTNLWNALYTSTTKIPQTDAGTHSLVTVAESTCASYVANGLGAPGTWTTAGFGSLNEGDFLSKGYYVYAQPVSQQATADRAARKSVPIQIAFKLAGAIHSVNVSVTVNR